MGLPVDRLSDEVLLSGFSSGDEELTVAFVRRFQAKVFGIALAVTGEPRTAEDVAQQAFERVWRHGRAYDPLRGSVKAWLGAITRNLAIDATRLSPPVPVDSTTLLHTVAAANTDPGDRAVGEEVTTELRRALRTLPDAQARAVVLAGIAGLSAGEVAESEGIPLGTAKTRIRSAMLRLRKALTEAGHVHG